MMFTKGITVKPFHILLVFAALGFALSARSADAPPTNPPALAPKLTPEAEAAARAALEKAYTETNPASPAPTRTAPTRVTNAPGAPAAAVTAAPVSPAAAATNPAAAPAPAQPQKPGGTVPQFSTPGVARPATNRAVTASAQTNRPPTTTTGTPVIPGATQPPAAGQRNVAGAPQPAGANATTVPGGAPGVAGQQNRDDEILPPGLIKFQDADIAQVLEIYQELTGRTVLKPSSLPATKITIRTQTELTRAEAVQALDSILSMNGITMTPQGTKFVKAVAEAQAGNAASAFNDLPAELLPESGTYVTHVIQLTNASPNDILPVLQPFAKAPNRILTIPSTGMLVLRDYAENVKRMLEMIAKVDVVPVQEFESVVIPIKYALAGDIAQVLGGLTAGGGGVTTVGGQRSNTGLSGAGGGFGGAGGGLGGAGGLTGQPGYNPSGQNQFNRQGGLQGGMGGTGGTRGSFQNRLQQIVNRAGGGDRKSTRLNSSHRL